MTLPVNGYVQQVEVVVGGTLPRAGYVQPVESSGGGGLVTGSGAAGQVTFWTGAQTVSGNNALFWDNTNVRLTVGAAYIYTAGTQNLFIGKTAGNLALAGNQNVGIGESALASLTTAAGQFNTMCGYQAGMHVTSGHSNTGFGTQALFSVTTGINNSAVGYSFPLLTTGQQNAGLGDNSAANAVTNVSCTAIGYQALFTSTGDSNCTAVGANALYTLNGANNNTAVGVGALTLNQTGANNTGIGQAVLGAITSGGNNCGLGQAAGGTLTTGDHGTFLGTAADANGTGYSYACAIGAGAIVGASSTMALGGTSTAAVSVVINGTTAGRRLDIIDASNAQLRLSQASASKYGEFQIDSSGNLTYAATGTLVTLNAVSLAVGTTPATTGQIRIPNNQAINARNAANSSNLNLIFADGSNQVNVGVNAIFDTSGNLSIGTTPATSGVLRIPNNTSINSRNAANTSNLNLIFADASNNVNVGVNAIFNTSGNLSLGATPAASGQLRMVSAGTIRFRNAGNTADIIAFGVDGSDNVTVGGSNAAGIAFANFNTGFFGTAPVAKQSSAGDTTYADSGATVVHSAGTFTGGTGATGYTIGDIVKALKNYGLLTA